MTTWAEIDMLREEAYLRAWEARAVNHHDKARTTLARWPTAGRLRVGLRVRAGPGASLVWFQQARLNGAHHRVWERKGVSCLVRTLRDAPDIVAGHWNIPVAWVEALLVERDRWLEAGEPRRWRIQQVSP